MSTPSELLAESLDEPNSVADLRAELTRLLMLETLERNRQEPDAGRVSELIETCLTVLGALREHKASIELQDECCDRLASLRAFRRDIKAERVRAEPSSVAPAHPSAKTCDQCRGAGKYLGPGGWENVSCSRCHGSGRVPELSPTRRLAHAMVSAVPKLGDFSDRDVMRLAEVAMEFLKEGA